MATADNEHSLETTRRRLALGYGDPTLVANVIIDCLACELALRDARIEALEARLRKANH
jgi:hypothetical protein